MKKCSCLCHPISISGFKRQLPIGHSEKVTCCDHCEQYEIDVHFWHCDVMKARYDFLQDELKRNNPTAPPQRTKG
jgi:hypothetical protein